MLIAVIVLQQMQDRGRRVMGGTRQYLPLKVNQAGVMPIIFASSLLMVPYFLLSVINNLVDNKWSFGNRLAGEFISEKLAPQLHKTLQQHVPGLSASVDEGDPQVVNIRYPAAFTESYIRPEVRLEIGPLASWVPSELRTIQPYAAQIFPKAFEHPSCSVLTIIAERTFWEKVTILHQEAHRTGCLREKRI